MEKKNPKIHSTTTKSERIYRANRVQLAEENGLSLVGGIIEKGISELGPTPPPQPSLLPFPVARHRSHGPHWSPLPVGSQKVVHSDHNEAEEEGEDDDEEDANVYKVASSFANPLQKKIKKGLDFSCWKHLISDAARDDSSMPTRAKLVNDEKRNPSMDIIDPELSDADAKKDFDEVEMADTTTLPEGFKNNSYNRSPHRPVSLETEIDVENRARLLNMMPDEIAEAQSELMDKMSPALLNMLKRRGQDKFKRIKAHAAEQDVTITEDKSIQNEKGPSHTDSDISNREAKVTSKETLKGLDIMVQNSGMASGSLWNSWSQRVEAVRDLRFSLDGTIILANFAAIAENERDFIRTEGDPGAAGYTIKEAVALTRSVISGQRAFALRLLATVVDKALHNIQQNKVGSTLRSENIAKRQVDWEAVWAFVLGPESELVLTLRMCLDDNHDSVVIECVKAIQSVLSCDLNEDFFHISEKIAFYGKAMHTAPVFRTKPEIDLGLLLGGFWKYSAKSSNLLPNSENVLDDETEGSHTIKDDIVFAGQDFTAGLVRMGILPRLRYILETSPLNTLEECTISILVAIARHSPECANAVMKCPRLVQTIVQRFTTNQLEIHPSMIKSVCLLKVLAQSDKKNCAEFLKNDYFKAVTWQLYQFSPSLDSWLKFGTEKCKLSSSLMVEQLRLWRVCIQYGYCITCFPDLFSALCLWLTPPTFEKLIEKNLLSEFSSISTEFYLVIQALCSTLPDFYSQETVSDNEETWSWSYVGPMVDLGVKWFSSGNLSLTPLLWVFSAIMHFFSSLLVKVCPEDTVHVPWLPEFIPKIGLEIIRNGVLSYKGDRSFIEYLCCLRQQSECETSVASVCCLHGLTQVVYYLDNLIKLAKVGIQNLPSQDHKSTKEEEEILEHGIMKLSLSEFQHVLDIFIKFVESEWQIVQSIETFGRGGPSPGLGYGWGASGGGFWSLAVLLAQMDACLLVHLLKIIPKTEETAYVQMVNSVLGSCLSAGPKDKVIIEKSLDILFQVPVLKYLNHCIKLTREKTEAFGSEYKDEDYLFFCNTLSSHFKNRWLCTKKRKSKVKNASVYLETIHEDSDFSNMVEWAHQRLPLPMHWFLSPLSTIYDKKSAHQRNPPNTSEVLEVIKCGLFFLLGIEAMSNILPVGVQSPVKRVSLVWKLHSLSVTLLIGMGVLEDEKSRVIFETLQKLYGQLLVLENLNSSAKTKDSMEILKFGSDVHDGYSTFVETLVEQYAAESYGDLLYGRQVAVYLHRSVETSVRLATWNALFNARALELLPPLDKCLANDEGYLEPVEENEDILDAYVKSWVSGALDKAATRGSVAYTLALHHLSSFIFLGRANIKLSLRNRLAKSLLRDFSQKEQHKGMMLNFIQYQKASKSAPSERSSPSESMMYERFEILKETCDGNSTLLIQVEKLRSLVN